MSAPGIAKAKPGIEFRRADIAAKFILRKTKLRPRIGLVLGSGLGAFADDLAGATRIDYAKIPNFPRSTAIGHAGRMVIGKVADVPVAVMQGRVHLYEGYTPQRVIFPMRVMARMGIRSVLITNAAGGINRDYKQGCLVVLRDHINLQSVNPLIGPNENRFGVRFPDLTQVYWKPYQEAALAEGKRLGVEMAQGVYAGLSGPSYETPAEIHYLRAIGADLVGMSTVPEVIAAAHLGIRVLGISCVTNMAAGILDQPITTEEVIETGERVKADFVALLRAVIPRMSEDIEGAKNERGN
jgi:purine-nucleoside phosphorylase